MDERLYRDQSCRIYENDLCKYCPTKWRGWTQFGSIRCGVNKAGGILVETKEGKESAGVVNLDLSFRES